jgi:hypothetical protein
MKKKIEKEIKRLENIFLEHIKIYFGKKRITIKIMYTDLMRHAVYSIPAPKGFGVEIIDNEHFLTIKLDEKHFAGMAHDDKIAALQYTLQLKKALEMEGAIVLVTREALQ